MRLLGKLKENVEKAKSIGEAKEEIAKAGMELTDEEMATIAGGNHQSSPPWATNRDRPSGDKRIEVANLIREWKSSTDEVRKAAIIRQLENPELREIAKELDPPFANREITSVGY